VSEPRTFTLTLPPGTRVLSANNRLHRYAEAAEVKRLRSIAITLAKQQHIPPLGQVTILLEYQLPSAKHPMASQFIHDHDNLFPTLKALTDGIRRAGVITQDSREFVLDSRPRISEERYPLGRLLLHVTEVLPVRERAS